MKEIWFIRHGESESNAGLPTRSAASPPLTPKGRLQASLVSQSIPHRPDLIILSTYLRTHQTADPTITKYPQSPLDIWPVHEFTFLSAPYYLNTTTSKRHLPSAKYWLKSNPDHVDGDLSESFHQMIQRVTQTIENLKKLEEKFVVVFSHGWFLRAILWQQFTSPSLPESFRQDLLRKIRQEKLLPAWAYHFFRTTKNIWLHHRRKMFHYLIFASTFRIPNTSILKFAQVPGQELKFQSLSNAHLTTINARVIQKR